MTDITFKSKITNLLTIRRWHIHLPILFILFNLIQHYLSYSPIETGTKEEFWDYACEIQVKNFKGHMKYSYGGGVYPKVNGKYYYFTQEHHQQYIYEVSQQELLANFDDVITELKSKIPSFDQRVNKIKSLKKQFSKSEKGGDYKIRDIFEDSQNEFTSKRERCSRLLEKYGSDYTKFLDALVEDLKNEKYFHGSPEFFRSKLKKSTQFNYSYIFEFFFLCVWILFCFWPSLGDGTPKEWGKHIGLGYFILFIPHFLGYGDLWSYGETGSIIYSWFATLLSVPLIFVRIYTPIDSWIWNHLPQPLYYLNNESAPMAKSYAGGLGFVGVILVAIILGLMIFAWKRFRLKMKKKSN